MERSGPNGPGGTGGTGGGPPGSADGETLSDESGVPARDPEPTTRIPTTRTVVLGGEEPHEDVPIELTEEPEEESAAPLIDDAGPLDPDEEAALGDLDLRATPPKPLVVSHPTPAVPTLSPGRRSSEPPSHAAYRATSAGSVIPVPPPFVPFPGVAPVAEGRPATHRAAVPFVPYGAAAAAPE
ncbi:MAG: hypothetical protein HY907_22285, partial [Deltaproteobacteria bacterium]|nr:hypothetical protein [Deltaproteobacteria bacterium]